MTARRRVEALEAAHDLATPLQPVGCALPHESDADARCRLNLPADARVIRVHVVDQSTEPNTTEGP